LVNEATLYEKIYSTQA